MGTAFAAGMAAAAIDVRRFSHGFALRSAVLAVGRGLAGTIWMSAFLVVVVLGHFDLLLHLQNSNDNVA